MKNDIYQLGSRIITRSALIAAVLLSHTLMPTRTVAADSDSAKFAIQLTPKIPLDVTNGPNVPREISELVRKHEIPKAQRLFDIMSWRAFIALNWPTKEKGKPGKDLSDNTSWRAWQYWRSASSLFLTDGAKPEPWSGELHHSPKIQNMANQIHRGYNPNEGLEAFTGPLVDQNGKWVRFDIRVNEQEFNYIYKNELYSLNGQVAFSNKEDFNAVMMPLNTKSTPGAIEIKLAWKKMGPNDDQGRFYTTDIEVTTAEEHPVTKTIHVGLVGMHIAMRTQSSPEWIWSTFEQIDNVRSNPIGDTGAMSHPNFFNPSASTPVNTLPDKNAYLDPNTNQLVPPTGNNANSWIESKTIVPTQATRVVVPTQPGLNPWDETTSKIAAEINKQMQAALRAKKSVFQYYELIDTQWPLHPNFPAFAGGNNSAPESVRFKTPGDMIPVFLINTTMETYFQHGPQAAGGMEQDDRIGDNSVIDKTQINGTESCVGCHYSSGIATGFKTKPKSYDFDMIEETNKPKPIFGENNHFGKTGGANFSWMLQLEPQAHKGAPAPLPYNIDLPAAPAGK